MSNDAMSRIVEYFEVSQIPNLFGLGRLISLSHRNHIKILRNLKSLFFGTFLAANQKIRTSGTRSDSNIIEEAK